MRMNYVDNQNCIRSHMHDLQSRGFCPKRLKFKWQIVLGGFNWRVSFSAVSRGCFERAALIEVANKIIVN